MIKRRRGEGRGEEGRIKENSGERWRVEMDEREGIKWLGEQMGRQRGRQGWCGGDGKGREEIEGERKGKWGREGKRREVGGMGDRRRRGRKRREEK